MGGFKYFNSRSAFKVQKDDFLEDMSSQISTKYSSNFEVP